MPRRDTEPPELNGYGEASATHWPNIGIDAVTAASMYCDHAEPKRHVPPRIFGDSRDDTGYATD